MNEIEDQVIEDFLEGQPRAEYWRELRDALAARLEDAIASNDAERIAELRAQVDALAQEHAITEFVEDSVRASLSRPRGPGDIDEFDYED